MLVGHNCTPLIQLRPASSYPVSFVDGERLGSTAAQLLRWFSGGSMSSRQSLSSISLAPWNGAMTLCSF
jgi:hypothetical protein